MCRCLTKLALVHQQREEMRNKKESFFFFFFFFGMSLRWYNHTRNSETAQARKRVVGLCAAATAAAAEGERFHLHRSPTVHN